MKRKIAVVTSSRADYSHLYWPLRELAAHPDLDMRREYAAQIASSEAQSYAAGARADAKVVLNPQALD